MLLYAAVMAGLLFLAFAFFAVAQASTVRNGGQSAADAAALAAAQDDRDRLFDGLLDAVEGSADEGPGHGGSADGGSVEDRSAHGGSGHGELGHGGSAADAEHGGKGTDEGGGEGEGAPKADDWRDWLDALVSVPADGCGAAGDFAARNHADLTACDPVTRDGDDGYTVRVRTRFDTGDTLLPGTDHRKARATATAVVRPRCAVDDPGTGGGDIELTCDGDDVTLDPDDDDPGLEPSDLFSVVLVD